MIAEVVGLSGYESQVSALLSEDEQIAMEFFIACAPQRHPVIPGSGGFRKARWARRGKGKSGGARVIYFFLATRPDLYGCNLRQIAPGESFRGRSERAHKARGTD